MRKLLAFALATLALPLALAAQPATVPKPAAPPDVAAPPADAQKLEDGLALKRLVEGTGTEKPSAEDIVKIKYAVWTQDGKVVAFVTVPAMIGVPNMLPGWREAAMTMVTGEKTRAWVPPSLGAGKIKEGETFVIDTELVEIIHPPTTPADVAAPPADATMTTSGLAYKVLTPGKGDQHPKKGSDVTVHYSGWTTDGKMFDSSLLRGEPATFSLREVIPGWTEGMQLLTVGEKARFWIPSKLAYNGQKGKPQGMLVFDIELLAIK